jgi:hypothetical protein
VSNTDNNKRIDFSLQRISKEDLHRATTLALRPALDRRDLGMPYMTSWESNQVYWGGYLSKTLVAHRWEHERTGSL